MRILGIETSCDETAAAIVDDGSKLLSNVVSSQIDLHRQYGGVVPEIAARSHIEIINPVIEQAINEAGTNWDEIDAIAVTYGPGLSGSLLIGTLAARTLALTKQKPLYPVNHVLGHVFANFLMDPQPSFPMLALIVSGGHTQFALFHSHLEYVLLGQTQDDAVGEAFDKVAKIIGLDYPGGPSIERASVNGNPDAYSFPKARMPKREIRLPSHWLDHLSPEKAQAQSQDTPATADYLVRGSYDFSFSGLKTAVLRRVQAECDKDFTFPSHELSGLLSESQRNDFAASFNRLAIETLVDKTKQAFDEFQPASVVIAGGVAASKELRRQLSEALPLELTYADFALCTDNAAMIAALGYYYAQAHPPVSPHDVVIEPNLKM
jgi:N6-L-threonylcarbamoyladenine synthase